MSTMTMKSAALPKKPGSQKRILSSNPLRAEPLASEQSSKVRVYWGDWIALKVLVAGFAIMAAMNLFNLIASLFRP